MAQLAINGGDPLRKEPWAGWPIYDDTERKALIDELERGVWGIGSQSIDGFEKKFAEFCQVGYSVACTNGTEAIAIALKALNVGAGDEVIVPPYTFIATAVAPVMMGAVPVFADIDPKTYNIDPVSIKEKITDRTKAIIPVHISGNPADMDAINAIAKEHNLVVLEDSAQAVGAEWKGKRVGGLGDAATFSFQSSKNLPAGEGGAITANSEEIADRVRTFVNCGRVKGGLWYEHHELAGNHRLSGFSAAILLAQMTRVEEQMKQREENVAYLRSLFNQIDGISLTEMYEGATRNAYHLGIGRFDSNHFKGITKQRFVEACDKEGLDISNGYMPVYKFHVFRHFAEKVTAYPYIYKDRINYSEGICPVCEKLCDTEAFWLSQETFLGTKQDMDDIAAIITKVQKNADEL